MASPRGSRSRTLAVSGEFLKALKGKYPDLVIDDLDLYKVQLPEVHGGAVDAKYALMSGGELTEQSRNSWELITKYSMGFMEYDAFLISNPMWNFTIPYKLKHYIDVIMQAGILFNFTATGVEGLALQKKMFCITSRGNDYSEGGYMHAYDFQEPYLRSIFGLAGIRDIQFIHAQPLDIAAGLTQASLEKAYAEARAMAQSAVL